MSLVLRRTLLIAAIVIAATAIGYAARARMLDCAAVPLLAPELLPTAALAPGASPALPDGWGALAPGVTLRGPKIDGQGFDLDGDGRSLQLLGIANAAIAPPVAVTPGRAYCFAGRALTDTASPTRARLRFVWSDAAGAHLGDAATPWQPVVRWTKDAPPAAWSPLLGAAVAPPGAATLRVAVEPSSDDRVYLDAMHLRPTLGDGALHVPSTPPIAISPWPNGARAAVSFSFDWETEMGGLIHSRSLGDPNATQDPALRAMRMRDGVTTTLAIFRPYGIRATYYATGYNFLDGNAERRTFMGDPVFPWASSANRWRSDAWTTRRWFADDPHGTTASDPGWYFGDLVAPLLAERQAIESHTFSHLYGGLASLDEWRADLAEWRAVAAEKGVASARSLAFPWSGSGGMSDAAWDALARAGIASVTRTSDQAAYRFVSTERPRCAPVPGHETIIACPDVYLTTGSVAAAKRAIDAAIDANGAIDVWAHTEEVVTPAQIAAWREVVGYAADGQTNGDVWIAPLSELTDRQRLTAQVDVTETEMTPTLRRVRLSNRSGADLPGLTLLLPPGVVRARIDGLPARLTERGGSRMASFDLPAGASVTVELGAP